MPIPGVRWAKALFSFSSSELSALYSVIIFILLSCQHFSFGGIFNFQNCRRYTLHRLTGSDNWHAGLWGNLSQFDTFQLLTTHCSKALFTTVDSTVFSFVHNVSCFALSYKLDFRCAGSRVEVVKILVYLDLLDAKVLDMLFPKKLRGVLGTKVRDYLGIIPKCILGPKEHF